MKLKLANVDVINTKIIISIEHKGQLITFQGSAFKRSHFEYDDIFGVLNLYLDTLPESILDKVFSCYSTMKYAMEDIWNRPMLSLYLENAVQEMYSVLPVEPVKQWLLMNVRMPELESFVGSYEPSMDDVGSRDQTYLRSDYTDLAALSIILRLMIPIWNEFIDITRKDYGNNFKEYYAYRLLKKSYIYECATIEKLKTWISYPLASTLDDSYLILSGISSEDIPLWLLAMIVVRRLVVGIIGGDDPSVNLITFIHKFMIRKIKTSKPVGSGTIRDKTIREGDDSEEKETALDRYKIKYNLAPGEIIEMEFVMSNLDSLYRLLAPNIDKQIIERNLITIKRLEQMPIREEQIILVSWVLSKIIPARGLMYINKRSLLNGIVAAQSIAWHMGYPLISFLMSGFADRSNVDYMLTGTDGKARIPKEIVDELNILFPYAKRTGRKSVQGKTPNVAIKTIDKIVTQFSNTNWVITADDDFIKEAYGEFFSRYIVIPIDIKIQLCKFLIELTKIRGGML